MKKLLMITIALMLFAPLIVAQEAMVWNPKGLEWDHNTEADLAGYFIYETTTQGDYEGLTFAVSVPAGTNRYEFPVDPKHPDGTFYWVLTAYDLAGNESGHSNEVVAGFDYTPPAPPAGCKTFK